MENKYLQFVQVNNDTTELFIYGDIRKGSMIEKLFEIEDESRTDALTFAEKLASLTTPNLKVRINSYGGVVSEGLAIYNLLKSCGKNVTTVCDGFACSAASVIFCAGSKRIMPKTSLLMIHNAYVSGVEGNANELRKQAEDLEKITQPSVEAYKVVSNLEESEIKELMDNETWISADEALNWGFATEVTSDEEPEQSCQDKCLFNLVMKNKSLEQEILSLKENQPEDKWAGFFNSKK